LESFKEDINKSDKLASTIKDDIINKLDNKIAKLKNNAYFVLKKQSNPSMASLA